MSSQPFEQDGISALPFSQNCQDTCDRSESSTMAKVAFGLNLLNIFWKNQTHSICISSSDSQGMYAQGI